MNRYRLERRQVIAAVVLLVLASVRAVWPRVSERLDEVFLFLVAAALLLLIVPLQRVSSFKAGGFEVTLDTPQVSGAVASLGLDRIESESLKGRLQLLSHLLPEAKGAKVLWIDDCPEEVLGERRLLRAFGVTVVTATSSERALDILSEDNDFDLIVTDVQRAGESYRITGGIEIHEGTNFICWLRREHPDPVVRALPVIFYAAYDWQRLVAFTKPARESQPEPEISNSVLDLIPKILIKLAESRARPIMTPESKVPTDVRRPPDPAAPAGEKASLPGH